MVRFSKERKNMTMKDYMNAKARIWKDESHNVTIVNDNGMFYAECDSTMQRRKLDETNCDEVLNDMFYDYCVENAGWMGVS